MKREERKVYNGLKKTVTPDTLYVEIPTAWTHEARQTIHELLTVEKGMIATVIGPDWRTFKETIRYTHSSEATKAIRQAQEVTDIDEVMKELRHTDYTWNGYKANEEEPAQTESKEEENTMKTPYNTPIEKSTVNPMCTDCTRFGKDCEGTSCQTWTGCVYKRRTDAEKTICKPKLIYQPDAPEDARYNVQLWHSYDGGKTFYYAGYGRFFKDFYEAEAWRKQHRKNLSYDLMFGRLGNGTTVSNMAREERGDYPAIAHIDDCGAVRWYVDTKKLPPYVLEDVNAAALRDMAEFKEKFLKLTPLEALRAVYDTFPMNTIRNDISKETTQTLYEIYTEFMAQHGYTMPEQ